MTLFFKFDFNKIEFEIELQMEPNITNVKFMHIFAT